MLRLDILSGGVSVDVASYGRTGIQKRLVRGLARQVCKEAR